MSTIYPQFKGIQFGFCHLSAGAEIYVNPTASIVTSVSINDQSFSGEFRKYIHSHNRDNTGFVSTRFSTRKNIGLGFGIKSHDDSFIFTPCFGVSYNFVSGNFKPFISIGFTL